MNHENRYEGGRTHAVGAPLRDCQCMFGGTSSLNAIWYDKNGGGIGTQKSPSWAAMHPFSL